MSCRLLHARDGADPDWPSRAMASGGIAGVVERAAPGARARAAVDEAHRAGQDRRGQRDGQGNAVRELELEQVGVGQTLAGCRTDRAPVARIAGAVHARRQVVGRDLEHIGARQSVVVEGRFGPVAKARLGRRELAPAHPARGKAVLDMHERGRDRQLVADDIARAGEPGTQPAGKAAPDARGLGVPDGAGPRGLDGAVHDRLTGMQHQARLERQQSGQQHQGQRKHRLDGCEAGAPASGSCGHQRAGS
jgi:hypothetical protein